MTNALVLANMLKEAFPPLFFLLGYNYDSMILSRSSILKQFVSAKLCVT